MNEQHGKRTYERMLTLPVEGQHSVFLFGPRGTGKTTWLREHLPSAHIIDLLNVRTYTTLMNNPSELLNHIPSNHTAWVIIDEIQKIPDLLNEVHRLIEHHGIRFILTGSSARSLRRKGVNLLAGRALDFRLHPLTCWELQKDFDYITAIKIGLLPSVYNAQDPSHYLESYMNTYLREEVLQEGLVRDLGGFSRFLEIASFSQGEVVNYSEIARESLSERRLVHSYFDILEDMLIGTRLPVFRRRAKRKLTHNPKFYFFDAGVYRTIRPKGPLDSEEELDGPALETLFLQHLRAINDYKRLGYTFYFWRTANQVEVDFIAYGEHGLLAFEIKRKRRINPKDLKGLRAFKKDYDVAQLYVFYGGKDREYHGDIQVIPFEEGLFDLETILRNDAKP